VGDISFHTLSTVDKMRSDYQIGNPIFINSYEISLSLETLLLLSDDISRG